MIVDGIHREHIKVDVEPSVVVEALISKYTESCVGCSGYDIKGSFWYKDPYDKSTKIRKATKEEVETMKALYKVYQVCCEGGIA